MDNGVRWCIEKLRGLTKEDKSKWSHSRELDFAPVELSDYLLREWRRKEQWRKEARISLWFDEYKTENGLEYRIPSYKVERIRNAYSKVENAIEVLTRITEDHATEGKITGSGINILLCKLLDELEE